MVTKNVKPNRADSDQTASSEAVWSGSSLFAILTDILWIPDLSLTAQPFRKVFKLLVHLLYLFDLILYIPSTIFQLYRDGSPWVEPVLI